MLYKFETIQTGSSGNCYILSFENGRKIQLDMGWKKRNDKPELIDTIYVTHGHDDHYQPGQVKKFKEVIKWSEQPRITEKYDSFVVPHVVTNNGYCIREDGETIIYITDCGNIWDINYDGSKATYLIIECNWDYELVKNKLIPLQPWGDYAFSNKGHMSNVDCLALISRLRVPSTCKILFVHKSGAHATYDHTYNVFERLPNKWHVVSDGDVVWTKIWKPRKVVTKDEK